MDSSRPCNSLSHAPSQTRDRSRAEEALDIVDQKVQSIHDLVCTLNLRLSPVIQPEPRTQSDPQNYANPVSKRIVDRLAAASENLEASIHVLADWDRTLDL